MHASSGTWFGIALALSAAGARAAWSAPDSVWTVPADAPVETARTSSADPSDQALFLMPTAFLPPAKAFAFRDFDLLFMTFGYSPGARTAISGGFLLPAGIPLAAFTAGLKQNLWSEGSSAAVSITGNLTQPFFDGFISSGFFANTNLVASKRFTGADGRDMFGIHGAVGYVGHRERSSDSDPSWNMQGGLDYGLGVEAVLTRHAKFLVEYLSTDPFYSDNSFQGGVFSLGFRVHDERLAADIAGLRLFQPQDPNQLKLLPLIVLSYRI